MTLQKSTLVLVCGLVIGLASPVGAQLINESFDGLSTPSLPAGWSVEDANGDGYAWITSTLDECSAPNTASIRWNSAAAMNDWLFTPGVSLSTGHTYTLTFNYRAASTTYPEQLTVYIGTSPSSAAMATTLLDLGAFNSTTCQQASATDFTVPASGTYYIGFWGHSAADMYRISVDDVLLVETTVPVEMMSFSIE